MALPRKQTKEPYAKPAPHSETAIPQAKPVPNVGQVVPQVKQAPQPEKKHIPPAPSGIQMIEAKGNKFERKKRRRRKKPKAQPVRSETQIDNTQKNKPAKFTPKTPEVTKEKKVQEKTKAPMPKPNKGGEIHLEELKKGEIELNLD